MWSNPDLWRTHRLCPLGSIQLRSTACSFSSALTEKVKRLYTSLNRADPQRRAVQTNRQVAAAQAGGRHTAGSRGKCPLSIPASLGEPQLYRSMQPSMATSAGKRGHVALGADGGQVRRALFEGRPVALATAAPSRCPGRALLTWVWPFL
jgi:hypothetical protein